MAQVPCGAVPPTVPETIRWTPVALATIFGAQQEGKTGCRQRRWPAAIVREKGAVTTHQTRPKPLKREKETVQVQVILRDESGGQRTKYNLVARQHRTAADTAGPPQPTRKGYGVEVAGSDVPRYTDAKKGLIPGMTHSSGQCKCNLHDDFERARHNLLAENNADRVDGDDENAMNWMVKIQTGMKKLQKSRKIKSKRRENRRVGCLARKKDNGSEQ